MWTTGPAPTTARRTGKHRRRPASAWFPHRKTSRRTRARRPHRYSTFFKDKMRTRGGRGHADERGGHRRRAPGEHGPGQLGVPAPALRPLRGGRRGAHDPHSVEAPLDGYLYDDQSGPSAPWGVNAEDGHKSARRPAKPTGPRRRPGAATPRTAPSSLGAARPSPTTRTPSRGR